MIWSSASATVPWRCAAPPEKVPWSFEACRATTQVSHKASLGDYDFEVNKTRVSDNRYLFPGLLVAPAERCWVRSEAQIRCALSRHLAGTSARCRRSKFDVRRSTFDFASLLRTQWGLRTQGGRELRGLLYVSADA
eukprot:scaffold7381_cov310-Pinguiococcus_pyrenoidosus.AAC.61